MISPLIEVYLKSTNNNTKGRSEKSASDVFPHQQCKSAVRPIFSRVQPLSGELQRQHGAEATGCYTQTSSCTTTLSFPILWMNFLQYCQTTIRPEVHVECLGARLFGGYFKILRATSKPSYNQRSRSTPSSCRALWQGRRTQLTFSVMASACFKLSLQDPVLLVYTTSPSCRKWLCKWAFFLL